MKKINKNIFPEDFFDLENNEDNISHIKSKSKNKEHPKLLNPVNTIKIGIPQINEIKEEPFEESVEILQLKKTNLKIIIPNKSNDELEPSTSGSSNMKLSPNTPSPMLIQKIANDNTEEEKFILTGHFNNEGSNNIENKTLKKNLTPSINRHRSKYNQPPLTCDNKVKDKYKFNYNFETKNGVIIPKEDRNINKIQRQNLFKIGYKNNNKAKKNNKSKAISSRIGQIFNTNVNTPKNSPIVTIKNNFNNKNENHEKMKDINLNNNNKTNKKKNIKMNKPNSATTENKNNKKKKSYSMESKCINAKKNNKNNLINLKESKKNYSCNRKNFCPYISGKKVASKFETEINNIFKILPDDYEKDPEIKNCFDLIVKDIHGLKELIDKNNKK